MRSIPIPIALLGDAGAPVIHGKGIGALRETVHAILRRDPGVVSFGLVPGNAGGWGATVVELSAYRRNRHAAVQG